GRHGQAADHYRRWALAAADQPQAPEVHIEAVRNLAQAVKQRPDNGLDDFVALLEEHLARWSAAATAGEARWLLAGARRYQRDWPRAIAAYEAIGPGDARFAEAVDAAGQCCEARLTELAAQPQAARTMAAQSAAWFESIVAAESNRSDKRLSPAVRRAVLWAARLRLASAGGYEQVRRLLADALAATGGDDPWCREVETLLMVAQAGGGRVDEAGRTLERLAAADPAALADLVDRLQRLGNNTATEVDRQRLAALQLRAVDLLSRRQSELAPGERIAFARAHAAALAASGRRDEALQRYAPLVRAQPDDAKLGEAYAQLLAAGADRRSREAALVEWRRLESRSKPGSPRWFRAKYAIAELHLALGRPDRARKMIELLVLLHPDLGGPAMKARFEQLLACCQRPEP
ncbi:MAG: hypothetical protein JW719_10705, partial [Pirellulales bacterium]|nr:hypothetical protein [Pirellulales bacterium]